MVPVVITICVMPSSRTAASANWAGVVAATVAPERSDSLVAQNRQRWSSAYRLQVCTMVVASTFAPCRRAIRS